MNYKTATRNLLWRFIFVLIWNAIPYSVFLTSRNPSSSGNLPFALMAFSGLFFAVALLGKSVGDFIAASVNKSSQH
ncbi:hypothetical protein [Brucella oryzae]|uniref:hypothetical protein n=1 Tax=Brucella/Ochrobactrum group TaxID=2826938 RepID=UPI0011B0D9C9|nr:hypothetical protein [Brucella oryzae]MBA8838832.1 hypothetical protein [Ochrobactrum sp. RH2CCR150]